MENSRVLHYDVGRLLGRGGMGEVYEALDTRLGRRVALKFIMPSLAGVPEVVRRFEREAHASAVLAHPHIATLYALEHDAGRLFIVNELLPGGTLRRRMGPDGMAVAEALGLARDVSAALAHAHQRGIAHRDIKPENLMFASDRALKVTDFGLAQVANASQLTHAGTTIGTVSYMAPESVHGSGDARADVFALGVVLYEMLSGRLPFTADSSVAILYAIVHTEPRAVGEHRRGLPPGVEALVMSLLTKDPANRPDANAATAQLCGLTGVPYRAPDPFEPGAGIPGAEPFAADAMTVDVRQSAVPRPVPAAVPASAHPRSRLPRLAWAALALLVVVVGWGAWRPLRRMLGSSGAAVTPARALQARELADEAARFLTQGRLDSAEARANAALRLDGTNAGARINLAQVLRMRGEPTRAAALLSEVTSSHTADPRLRSVAWDALGDMAMEDQTWPEAVRALEQGFTLDSTERAYSQLGYAMTRAARPSEALRILRRGIATFPGSAALHKNAGYALLQLDSLPAATAEADRAIALDPAFGPALGLRARLEARLGDPRAAARDWTAFLAAHPAAGDSAEVAADLQRGAGMR